MTNLFVIIGIFIVVVAITYVLTENNFSLKGGAVNAEDPGQVYQRYWALLAEELGTSIQKKEITQPMEKLLKTISQKEVDYNKIVQGYLEAKKVLEDPEIMGDTVQLATQLYGQVLNYRSLEIAENSISPEMGNIMSLMQELRTKVMTILTNINNNFQRNIKSLDGKEEKEKKKEERKTPPKREMLY